MKSGAVPARGAAVPVPAAPSPASAGPAATQSVAVARQLWAGVHLAGISPQVLQSLGVLAQRFSPQVSLVPPDGLVLEVRGSLHLFDGLAGLRRLLTQACLPLHPRPLLAFAPTALAALAVARAGRPLQIVDPARLIGQLAPLPLAVLRWPEETQARLARMGVRTVGAALRLPRAGFARRFGAAQLALLDRLTGRTPDPRQAVRLRERFRRRCELEHEITDHERLLRALTPLWEQLAAFLEAHQCGVMRLECRLLHRHGAATCCAMRFAAPMADVQRLSALLRERLQQQPLVEPVRACELRTATVPHQRDSHPLWQPGEQGGGGTAPCADLVEHLRARFGAGAVYGLVLRDDHRPEAAWQVSEPLLPQGAGIARAPHGLPPQPERITRVPVAAARPLWLLREPRPLAERAGLPCRRGRPLHLAGEPERIETGWWDGRGIARDYYSAMDARGVRLWVFRERAAPHGWFLHGVFG
ncbi:MAG: DNA polymerase Y family protein [Proteobacteria bacterium]|nr:DNA polymerase Y family protein [Pseudomonadota bacterium]